jgi:DNA-binding response OmpR family regulator
MRIAIADDNPVFLRLLETFVKKWGFSPDSFTDGDSVYKALSQPGAPRLAILDWEMPGRTGLDVCRDLAKLNQPLRTYCILLTGHLDPAELASALEAGADDYVRKPMHNAEMRRRLEIWSRIIRLEESLAAGSELAEPAAAKAAQAGQRVRESADKVGELVSSVGRWWTESSDMFVRAKTDQVRDLGTRMDKLWAELKQANQDLIDALGSDHQR